MYVSLSFYRYIFMFTEMLFDGYVMHAVKIPHNPILLDYKQIFSKILMYEYNNLLSLEILQTKNRAHTTYLWNHRYLAFAFKLNICINTYLDYPMTYS